MTNSNSDSKPLADIAETDAIRRLLGAVGRRDRKSVAPTQPASAPVPESPPADLHPPVVAFVAETVVEETVESSAPPPLPEPERFETPVPVHAFAETFSWTSEAGPHPSPAREHAAVEHEGPEPVPQPIGAMPFGEFLDRINWWNRPEAVEPWPMIGLPDPPGHADTVEAVLAAFTWDDE